MSGFDWNGNAKSDAFDHFMDIEIVSDDDNIDICFDNLNGDDSDYLDDVRTEEFNYRRTGLIGTSQNTKMITRQSKLISTQNNTCLYDQEYTNNDFSQDTKHNSGKVLYDSSKDGDGMAILKSFTAVILCIIGFIAPIVLELEGVAVAMCLLGVAAMAILILKNK